MHFSRTAGLQSAIVTVDIAYSLKPNAFRRSVKLSFRNSRMQRFGHGGKLGETARRVVGAQASG